MDLRFWTLNSPVITRKFISAHRHNIAIINSRLYIIVAPAYWVTRVIVCGRIMRKVCAEVGQLSRADWARPQFSSALYVISAPASFNYARKRCSCGNIVFGLVSNLRCCRGGCAMFLMAGVGRGKSGFGSMWGSNVLYGLNDLYGILFFDCEKDVVFRWCLSIFLKNGGFVIY